MHRAKPKTPLNIMEKKIPVNPKYAKTQSKIDSGTTVQKVRLISHKEFLKRLDETFRRVSPKCLEELFGEYEDGGGSVSDQPEMVAKMVKKSDGKFIMERVPAEDNQSHGGASGPRIVSYEAEEQEEYDPPYLILDTRTKEEFAVNRIHRAKNFPAAYLNRDVLLPEMHRFKNQESKLIILYDQDEKTVTATAHTLVQRGFDNVYVLTGGIVDFSDEYPDRIEGLSLPKKPKDPSKKATKEMYKNAPALSTTGPKSIKSVSTRKKDNASDASSVVSTLSVAETVISRAAVRKARVATAANYR
ncbi:hypothetical protein Poli38472_010496 [Pythium oligandrum]|uniref:Rhodanese domain-containing protein n=1 Tax=Pythium oligandrum TaxID=41045 RepID=A0A8K1C345_PYTOL|nr:hypothetical protein Poli38472_010496 [Pythium oligandrum]|eukprot:TMW55614.1 hypothetical protein Poli38472_010496 [Pythium oligandrum]